MKKLFLLLTAMLGLTVAEAATSLTIARYDDSPWQGKHDWTLFSDDNENFFHFMIETETMESGKTYTLADMDESGSYLQNLSSKMPFRDTYSAVDFKWTVDGEGFVTIAVSLTTKAHGDYTLLYSEHAIEQPTDTTYIVMDDVVVTDYTINNWFIAFEGKNSEYELVITCNNKTLDVDGDYVGLGLYSEMGKLNEQATKLGLRGAEQSFKLVDARATVQSLAMGQYQVDAYMQDDQRHAYIILLTTADRPGIDTVAIRGGGLMIKDYTANEHPQVSLQCGDATYQMSIWLNAESLDGEYYGCRINSASVYYTETSEWTENYVAGYLKVETIGDETTVRGSLLMSDGIRYEVDFTTEEIEPQSVTNTVSRPAIHKMLRNGQLVIEQAGTNYSITGTRL